MDTPQDILRALGLTPATLTGGTLVARSPIDGAELAQVHEHTVAQAHAAITRARQASLAWCRAAANCCACSARRCASTSASWAAWSAWKPARSWPRAKARSRK